MPVHDSPESGGSGTDGHGHPAQYQSGVADRAGSWICHLRIGLRTLGETCGPMPQRAVAGVCRCAWHTTVWAGSAAHALVRQYLGEEHLDCVTALDTLGLLYKIVGNCTDAEPLLLQALEMRRHTLGSLDLARRPGALPFVDRPVAPREPCGVFGPAFAL